MDASLKRVHEATLLAANNGDLNTSLVQAAGEGRLLDTSFLLTHGANLDYELHFWTALALSADGGHLAVVTSLLDAGAMHLEGPLCRAVLRGHIAVAALLLARGANVHYMDDYPIRIAAEAGRVEASSLLLEHGADLSDNSALYMAALNGHLETVRLLLDYGADMRAENNKALRGARFGGHDGVVGRAAPRAGGRPERFLILTSRGLRA